MKRLLTSAAALGLMAAPALAQVSTSDASSAARAAAIASGGNSVNFAGSRNTPDVVPPHVSAAGTECQLPGFSLGGAFVGSGAAIGIPGGPDDECKTLRMAEFYMKVSLSAAEPREARQYRQAAIDLTCQVPRMKALALCSHELTAVSYAQPTAAYWYCRNPAGYYPTVPSCARWEMVGAR